MKVIKFRTLLILLFLQAVILNAFAQKDDIINVHGKAYDEKNPALNFPVLMVINYTTQQGFFGNADGTFIIKINKKDTLLISAAGYSLKKICFADSLLQNIYKIEIPLKRLEQTLNEVVIFPSRNIEDIEKDMQNLGYETKDYRLTGIDAWSAPLTALYQEFSRKEKDRRHAAELRNNRNRNDLLQELLRLYVKNDLIVMGYNEFDDFIEYLKISDDMIKLWSQYELALYIKSKYERYDSVIKK